MHLNVYQLVALERWAIRTYFTQHPQHPHECLCMGNKFQWNNFLIYDTIKMCAFVPTVFRIVPSVEYSTLTKKDVSMELIFICICTRMLCVHECVCVLGNACAVTCWIWKHTGGNREGNENQNPLKLLHLPGRYYFKYTKVNSIFVRRIKKINVGTGSCQWIKTMQR